MLVIFQSILWSAFGVILYREQIVDANITKLLGRLLYWFGVPLQIFFLARKSNFESIVWLPSIVTVMALLLGLGLALVILHSFKKKNLSDRDIIMLLPSCSDSSRTHAKTPLPEQTDSLLVKAKSNSLATRKDHFDFDFDFNSALPRTNKGMASFILASILGNTGFVGLALIPSLVSQNYWSWIVLYGVTHNVLGSYGLGVLVADYFGHSEQKSSWLNQLQNLLFLPSLWAFTYGYISRNLPLPEIVETIIAKGVLLVIPGAFILIGMQLSKLQQWQNLRAGVISSLLKMLVLPGITGLILTCFGMRGDSRLVLVLMSSMPTAFASIILAEAYDLERNIAASSILLSTLSLPLVLFLWINIF